MIADVFIGVGPFAMWENENEGQAKNCDEATPRSAYTAALWYIGARVQTLDECRSLSGAFDHARVPLAALSLVGTRKRTAGNADVMSWQSQSD